MGVVKGLSFVSEHQSFRGGLLCSIPVLSRHAESRQLVPSQAVCGTVSLTMLAQQDASCTFGRAVGHIFFSHHLRSGEPRLHMGLATLVMSTVSQ